METTVLYVDYVAIVQWGGRLGRLVNKTLEKYLDECATFQLIVKSVLSKQ